RPLAILRPEKQPACEEKSGEAVKTKHARNHPVAELVGVVGEQSHEDYQEKARHQHREPERRRHLPQQQHRPQSAGKNHQSEYSDSSEQVQQVEVATKHYEPDNAAAAPEDADDDE